MITRRQATEAALGSLAFGFLPHAGMAQSDTPPSKSGLRNRGTPTGRVGAAARDGSALTGLQGLELVAPQAGVGLTSSNQPVLFYLLSGQPSWPLHLTISVPNRARPLANVVLAPSQNRSGTGMVRLQDHGIRLVSDTVCTWSVTMQMDPAAPSRDIVASALMQYAPVTQTLAASLSGADWGHRYSLLTENGYWYDAAAVADASRVNDGGAAFRYVLRALGLPDATRAG